MISAITLPSLSHLPSPAGHLEGEVGGGLVGHDDGGPPVPLRLGGVGPAGHHLLPRHRQLREGGGVLPHHQPLDLMTLEEEEEEEEEEKEEEKREEEEEKEEEEEEEEKEEEKEEEEEVKEEREKNGRQESHYITVRYCVQGIYGI